METVYVLIVLLSAGYQGGVDISQYPTYEACETVGKIAIEKIGKGIVFQERASYTCTKITY